MNTLKLSARFLQREWKAGELHVLVLAVVIAVASVTTVGFFTNRVQQALSSQANQLLGADLVIVSDHRLAPLFGQTAVSSGLDVGNTVTFPSMVLRGDLSQLADIKAVSPNYPLRGKLRISDRVYGPDRVAEGVPATGTVWMEPRLLEQLRVEPGDTIELGAIRLKVAAVLAREPDRGGGFFSIAPRLMMNLTDLPKTELIQAGSRLSYRTLIAGHPQAVNAYQAWAERHVGRGERLEDVQDARPEIRSALERAQKYLGLASLVSAVLAAVAVAVSSRRFMQRHLDSCAVMRCVGASQSLIFRMYLNQFLLLGVLASSIGSIVGYVAQMALSHWLSTLVTGELPQPNLLPAAEGMLIGMTLLLAFSLPPLLQLKQVSTLRVLRREFGTPQRASIASYMLGFAAVAGLMVWEARDITLGLYTLAGLASAVLVAALVTWGLIRVIAGLRSYAAFSWFHGLANVSRRKGGSIAQVIAFGLGMMALLLLTLVRGDLMASWQGTLPSQAPNRFIINIQPDQLTATRHFFTEHGMRVPEIFPMVRARLVEINDKKVAAAHYQDERAQRLVEREFNLSWADHPQKDNRIVAGRWWSQGDHNPAQFSVEEGIAKTLGIRIGDRLTYDAAGRRFSATVSNLRKVEWDSFNVNFFVLAPPDLLNQYPASYITSFYLPENNGSLLNELVHSFPNFTIIDVAAVMGQVRGIMDRVASAIEFVFLFTLLAGLMVLYAAISATQDERIYEAAILRTLGASRRQLLTSLLAEFATIGMLSGFVAALGASGAGYVLSVKVLNLPFTFNPWVWAAGIIFGGLGVALAGWLGTRRTLSRPPLQTLLSA